MLSHLLTKLPEWRLHSACPLCDASLADTDLPVCQQCFAELPWCHTSGDTLHERSAFYYAAPIREYILGGKSSNQPDKLRLLGELIAIHFSQQLSSSECTMPQAIIPVPLHNTRLRQRGFNQAIELIRPFIRQHRLPLLRQAVRRNRNTGEQKGLTKNMRKTNVAHAFSIARPVNYQHIAIFDDVITTGATCAALRGLLLKHGVNRVDVWCCATTKNDLTV